MLNSQQQATNKGVRFQVFKILSIARPSQLINLLKLELIHEGYEVEVADDERSGLLKYRQTKPHLVILDGSDSYFSTLDLCCRLRSINNFVPILVIVNRPIGDREATIQDTVNLEHRVALLDAGADDCISVPFAMSEFLARIRVQLRKYQINRPSVLMFEDLRLDTATREVYRGDRYIYLTTKEFNFLEYLLAHPRQVLTRAQILDRVWGYDFTGDSNVIEVYVRYLRLKLEKNNGKRLIYTVRGVGYVLRASNF